MTAKEIEALIEGINEKVQKLLIDKANLRDKLHAIKKIEFEKKHGIKSGDKLTAVDGKVYFYVCVQHGPFDTMYVVCHPAKNDGTPSQAIQHLCEEDFF